MSEYFTPINSGSCSSSSELGAGLSSSSEDLFLDPNTLARIVDVAAQELASHKMPQTISSFPMMNEAPSQLTLHFSDGVYVGEVQNGQPHGRGTMDYYPGLDRKRYDGQWKDGEFHGKGLLILSNQNQYEGDWINGLFHGKGTFKHGDGSRIYEGEWQFGYQHGKGRMTIMTDRKHRGWYLVAHRCVGEQGSYHVGQGEYLVEYQGDYVCGLPHGHGDSTAKLYEKSTYKGEFRSGYPHGQCTHKYGEGDIQESFIGQWVSGHFLSGTYRTKTGRDEDVEKGVFRGRHVWEGTWKRDRFKSSLLNPYFIKSDTYQVEDGIAQQEIDVVGNVMKRLCCIVSLGFCPFYE